MNFPLRFLAFVFGVYPLFFLNDYRTNLNKHKILFLCSLFISFLIVFLKFHRSGASFVFIDNTFYGITASLLNSVTLFVTYFIFLSLVYVSNRVKNKSFNIDEYFIGFIALSLLGIFMHAVFFILNLCFGDHLLSQAFYFFYLYAIVISVFNLKVMMGVSSLRASVSFLLLMIPFVFLVGLPVVFPYLTLLKYA